MEGRTSSRSTCTAAICAGRCRRTSRAAARQDRNRARPPRQISACRSVLRRRAAHASRHVRLVPCFREERQDLGRYHHERAKHVAHDHVVFHMSSGASVTFNDPRRFGSMKLIARDRLENEPLLEALGPEPLGNEFDAAMLARACRGKKTSLKAALLDQRDRRRARQHLCLRGAVSRAAVAQAQGVDDCRSARRTKRAGGALGRGHQGGAARRRSRPAVRPCAITAGPTASSACFSTISRSTIAKASRAGRPAAAARSSASCRTAARRSIARHARNESAKSERER